MPNPPVAVPFTFSPNTPAYSAQVDADFAALVDYINTYLLSGGSGASLYPFNLVAYGADPTGATDSTTQILAAVSAGTATNAPFVLYSNPGEFLISTSIQLPSNCILLADAPGVSRWFASNSFVGQPVKSSSPGPSVVLVGNTQMGTASATPVQQNIYVVNMAFDGNGGVIPKPSANPGACVYLKAVYNCGVTNCDLQNCSADGIDIVGQQAANLWPGPNINWRIQGCHINLNYNPNGVAPTTGTFPISAHGASIGKVLNNTIGDLVPGSNHTNDGCDTPGCNDVQISDNFISNCGDGIGVQAGFNATITGNEINGAGGYGISSFSGGQAQTNPVGVSNLVIVGNNILNHGINPGTLPGKTAIRFSCTVYPQPPNQDCTISGNNIQFAAQANGPDGIHIEGNNCTCTGNQIDLGGSSLINAGINIDAGAAGGGDPMSGFVQGPGNQNIVVTGNKISNGVVGAGQTGIIFTRNSPPGGSTAVISNAVVTGNTVRDVDVAVSPTNAIESLCVIRDNPGINPIGNVTNITPVISGGIATITNAYSYDLQIAFSTGSGGTITNIGLNGQNMGLNCGANGNVVARLPAGWVLSSGEPVANYLTVHFTGTFGTDVTQNTTAY